MLLIQRIERVKKFFLRAVAPGEKVNVINHQQIDMPVAMAEILHVPIFNRQHELVDKRVAGQIENARVGLPLQHLLADALQQVTFSQSHAAVNKKRVVGLTWLLGNRQRGRMRQPIARAGDKVVENVVWIERERLLPLR